MTPIGCIFTYTDQDGCIEYGYTWHQPATNKEGSPFPPFPLLSPSLMNAECESYMGCLLPDGTINQQNETQCSACSGKYQPVFTWTEVLLFSILYSFRFVLLFILLLLSLFLPFLPPLLPQILIQIRENG
jgi:hypothetical protein